MNRLKEMDWWYWLVTDCLLLAYLTGWLTGWSLEWDWGLQLVMVWVLIHTTHYLVREKHITAFPVQVRLAYLLLLILGAYPPLGFLHWLQFLGTTVSLTDDYCFLARVMALMPWNRQRPLTLERAWNTIVAPPVSESILEKHT